MTLRDKYRSAVEQQADIEAEEQRRAFAPYTPSGMMKRVDEGLAEIAAKVEDDIAARIAKLASGKNEKGPITYRIEKISNLSEETMKKTAKLEGYLALRDVCARPENDVRVDVVLHHGCMNNGVDIRVYPDQPFKASVLAMDGTRIIFRKPRTSAAAAVPSAEQIKVMKPLVFAKPGA